MHVYLIDRPYQRKQKQPKLGTHFFADGFVGRDERMRDLFGNVNSLRVSRSLIKFMCTIGDVRAGESHRDSCYLMQGVKIRLVHYETEERFERASHLNWWCNNAKIEFEFFSGNLSRFPLWRKGSDGRE